MSEINEVVNGMLRPRINKVAADQKSQQLLNAIIEIEKHTGYKVQRFFLDAGSIEFPVLINLEINKDDNSKKTTTSFIRSATELRQALELFFGLYITVHVPNICSQQSSNIDEVDALFKQGHPLVAEVELANEVLYLSTTSYESDLDIMLRALRKVDAHVFVGNAVESLNAFEKNVHQYSRHERLQYIAALVSLFQQPISMNVENYEPLCERIYELASEHISFSSINSSH